MNINGAGSSAAMPVNCGMPGMHGNPAKGAGEKHNMSEMSGMSKSNNMPKNCGMKGMHNDAKTNQNATENSNIGKTLDVRA